MDIHIRTKLQGSEGSYIESAVIKIGEDMLEVRADTKQRTRSDWLNGNQNVDLEHGTSTLAGFPILYKRESHIKMGHKRHAYTVKISEEDHVTIKTFKHLINIHFSNPTHQDFQGSLGLLGSFDSGLRLGRDGLTEFKDDIKFGEEWQVLNSEPMLFHEVDGPQHPDRCQYVGSKERAIKNRLTFQRLRRQRENKENSTRRRRLSQTVTDLDAKKVCGVVKEEDRSDCEFDVVAMNDLDMVEMYLDDEIEFSKS